MGSCYVKDQINQLYGSRSTKVLSSVFKCLWLSQEKKKEKRKMYSAESSTAQSKAIENSYRSFKVGLNLLKNSHFTNSLI